MKLLLNEPGTTIRKRGDCLTIQRKCGKPVEVPVEDLSEILVAGNGIALSSDVVALAARAGLAIVFLRGTGEPYARAAAPAPAREALLRRQQYLAAEQPDGYALARRFVRTKLLNQANLLRYFARARRANHDERGGQIHARAVRIRNSARAIAPGRAFNGASTGRLLGLEGAAAHAYWEAIALLTPPECGFHRRVHQNPPDPLNAALNYGYGILRARVGAAVLHEGLDPAAGFLHAWVPGRDSLVLDLMEGFRPIAVDRAILAAVLRGWRPVLAPDSGYLEVNARKDLAALILDQLEKIVQCGSSRKTITDWIQYEVRACANALRGEKPAHPPIQVW